VTRREYPDEIDSRSSSYLAFMTDLETGWIEHEPHELAQIDARDAAIVDSPFTPAQ
jgi:hypothetical protein